MNSGIFFGLQNPSKRVPRPAGAGDGELGRNPGFPSSWRSGAQQMSVLVKTGRRTPGVALKENCVGFCALRLSACFTRVSANEPRWFISRERDRTVRSEPAPDGSVFARGTDCSDLRPSSARTNALLHPQPTGSPRLGMSPQVEADGRRGQPHGATRGLRPGSSARWSDATEITPP